MAVKLDKWIYRLCSVEGDGKGVVVKLLPSDRGEPWDTWSIEEEIPLAEQAVGIAKEAEEVVKSLAPDLPRKRHHFLLTVFNSQGVALGQQPLTVTGTGADGGLQSSATDAVAMAMTSVAQLWKTSLEVAQQQLAQYAEHQEKLQAQLLRTYEQEIDRKRVDAENTTFNNEQVEKVIKLAEEQLPAVIEMANYYIKKDKVQ